MKQQNNDMAMLEMIDRPGFFVKDGVITYVNTLAQQRLFEVGMSIQKLLVTGKAEYPDWIDGSLFLTLSVADTIYEATVSRMDSQDLFLLETGHNQTELKALALAASQLRQPLSDIMLAADDLTESNNAPAMGEINRGLYRLLRIIGNMSDAAEYAERTPNMQTCDLLAELEETLEQAKTLLEKSNIRLSFSIPNSHIFGLVDKEMLSRAVYNLLSNAAKYATPQSELQVSACRNGHLLYFSVSCPSSTSSSPADWFNRFLREPCLEDSRNGIGLGLVLVKAFAASHGGTVLIEKQNNDNVRFTMTMEIRKLTDATLCTTILRPDVYGGRNQGLVELSDVLHSDLFDGNY